MTVAPQAKITATELAGSSLAGRAITVVDVRDDVSWQIQAPGVEVVHVPAEDALARAGALAHDLPEGSVVACARGVTATRVADALRAEGLAPRVLEDGMRGWLELLRAVPLDTGVTGLTALQVQRPGRGCLSYLLGSGGEALVVDPAPDPDFYVALAAAYGLRIATVFDTHLHADHLSGARDLAGATGAALRMPLPTLGRGVEYAGEVSPVVDGEQMRVGEAELTALALPGHTTDMTGVLAPGVFLLSGDSLFADGIARPDLQRGDEEGARAMARTLHATLRERVLTLGDDVLLLPGHDHPILRAGPVAPTLGEVKRVVPELAISDSGEFADAILGDMPPRPINYEQVIAANAGRVAPDPELEAGGNSCATR